jgi:hypothetical protein
MVLVEIFTRDALLEPVGRRGRKTGARPGRKAGRKEGTGEMTAQSVPVTREVDGMTTRQHVEGCLSVRGAT